MIRSRHFFLLMIFILDLSAFSDPYLLTLSTSRTRSLGMGGSSVSVGNGLQALDFNPACFDMGKIHERTRASIYINGLAPLLYAVNWDQMGDWELALSFLFRGFSFHSGRINIGILYGEEIAEPESRLERENWFDADGFSGWRNTTFGFSLNLAPKVTLGAAGEIFMRDVEGAKRLRLGYRYGLALRTRHDLQIGICYIDFPDEYNQDRISMERLSDETLNVGVSYVIKNRLTLSMDIRNVSDENRGPWLEPHTGLEWIVWDHLALRMGYVRENQGRFSSISAGVGLWNQQGKSSTDKRPQSYALESALVWEKTDRIQMWVLLSFLIELSL